MKVVVIGAGAWGTTMAVHLARRGHDVLLRARDGARAREMDEARENRRYLPGFRFPDGMRAVAGEVPACDFLVAAVPTQFVRAEFGGLALPPAPLVSLAKGIEIGTGRLPTEIVCEVAGARPVAVLTGPCIAHEIVSGLPTAVVIAGAEAAMLQAAFNSDRFRVYASPDRVGAELSAALKNVLGIAAGIVDGVGLGDNAKAALLTRGVVELARLGKALGADEATFTGLAGFGDLFTTCVSPHGRNRSVGERIGRGEAVDDILASMQQVAEGVPTTKAVLELAAEHGVEMPIAEALGSVLFDGVRIEDALGVLMTREHRPE